MGDQADAVGDWRVGRDPSIRLARRRNAFIWAVRAALVVLILGLAQGLAPHLDPLGFSAPTSIFQTLTQWAKSGLLWSAFQVTAEEILIGYIVGAVAGIVAGILLGANPVLSSILDPVVVALYSVPKIALGPLLIVWFGIGLEPKLVLAATLVFFVVFYATFHGVREVDSDLVSMARVFGASPRQVQRFIVVPAALSSILLGLKLGVPQALFGAIVGEFIVSSQGLGYLVLFSASQLNISGVYAALLVLTVFAVLLTGGVDFIYGHMRHIKGEK